MVKRSKSGMESQNTAQFPDNTARSITPAKHRSFNQDALDSGFNTNDLTSGQIPMMGTEDGVAIASSMEETDTSIVLSKSLTTPPGSVSIGNINVSNAGIVGLNFEDTVRNSTSFVPVARYTSSGSSTPNYPDMGVETMAVVQSDDSSTVVGTVTSRTINDVTVNGRYYEFTAPDAPNRDGAIVSQYVFRFTTVVSNVRMVIRRGSNNVSGTPEFVSHTDPQFLAGNGVTTAATGDTTFDLLTNTAVDTVFAFEDGVTYTVVFETTNASAPQVRGTAGGDPYYARMFQPFELIDLVTDISRPKASDRPSTQSAALVQLSYDETNALGPRSFIEWTGAADLIFIPLMRSADDEGAYWRIYNTTSNDVRVQLQEISGTHKGQYFGDGTYSTDGREYEIPAGETVVITAFQYIENGLHRFNVKLENGGVNIQDGGTAEGTDIRTINFGTNLDVSVASGVATITGQAGGGGGPTLRLDRQDETLPSSTVDNTIVVCEATGTSLQTITLPDATSSYTNRRITVVNRRPDINGEVRVALASGDAIQHIFGDIDITNGQAWEFYVTEENVWTVTARGEIPLFPSFPSNPNNDDNTFMFTVNGDTSTTWTRDRNTGINLNKASGTLESYEIANPSTSGVTVADGDGYIFRNVNSNSWNIFPFSSANTMLVGGNTITSASPLVLTSNQSLVLLYDAGQSRWEGQVFNSLLPLASPGAGGSSEANSSSLPDSGKWFARNEDIVALNAAEGVSVKGIDGFQSMLKAGSGHDKFLNGFVTSDTAVNASNQVIYFGSVRSEFIWTGLNLIGDPISANDRLYWDELLSRVRTDDESGVHYECGQVLSSDWILGTGTTFTSNQTIDTQGEWDAWVNLKHVKGYATTGEVQIPDLQEGSSEVTAVAGQRFIVRVPFSDGTLTIRPRGASTIAPASGSGTTYTNATPLPMTGGASDEYVVIEVNANADGYLHYPINQTGIVTTFHFSALSYFRRVYAGQSYDMSVMIQANTQARATIQNPTGTLINSTSYSMGAVTGVGDRHLIATASGDATWTFTDSVGAIPSGSTQSITVDNSKRTDPILMVHAGRNYNGMNCDRMVVLPGETREFILSNSGGTLEISPVGPVAYEFTLTSSDVNGSNGFDLSSVPSSYGQLFETPTSGGVDRLVFRPDVAGDLECQIEFDSSWGGSTDFIEYTSGDDDTYFPNHTQVTTRLDDNGNTSTDSAIFNILHLFAEPSFGTFSHRFRKTGLVGNNWVNPVCAGLVANSNITSIKLHFKIILKES